MSFNLHCDVLRKIYINVSQLAYFETYEFFDFVQNKSRGPLFRLSKPCTSTPFYRVM